MGHPGEVIVEISLAQEAKLVAIGTEENVQATLKPVAIGVLPGRDLATRHFPFLQDGYFVAEVGKVLGSRQAC